MRSRNIAGVAIAICLLTNSTAAKAHTGFALLHDFVSGSFSASPFAPLIADGAGNLYGTASAGGNAGCVRYASTGCGTVFELSPPPKSGGSWTETVLYAFPGGNGPWFPADGLTMDSAGNLYGTTTEGGPYLCTTHYCGTAFKLTRPSKPGGAWKETTLYRFSKGPGGLNPGSGLTLDSKGNLYGTTLYYGPSFNGTVYRLSPSGDANAWWTETVLTGFDQGGTYPVGKVVFDKAGNLYGTTFYGGPYDDGLVFELTPTPSGPWTESVLYIFGGNACSPKTDMIFDRHGNLYGTAQGCPALPGAVFRLTPPPKPGGTWGESVLATFNGGTNYDPSTSVVVDDAGDVYGTTAGGGAYGHGTIFELTPPAWTVTILHSFKGWDGDFSTAGPVFGLNGALYGTTWDGGYRGGICKIGGCGVIFKVYR